MDITKVLDAAKEKLEISSDYALANMLSLNKQRISDYRKGDRVPDAYACARLAEVLEIDPFALLIEVEADAEKNPVRRAFWEGKRKTGQSAKTDPLYAWRARRDSNARPLPSEGSTLSS
jgi:transcriptional regulator with XRE-family HTH domain